MAGTLSVQKIQGLATSATPTVVEVSSGHVLHQPGMVIQVLQATQEGGPATTSNSYVSTGLFKAITPKFASSKILVHFSHASHHNTAGHFLVTNVYRDPSSSTNSGTAVTGGTALSTATYGLAQTYSQSYSIVENASNMIFDSPNTTSSVTYVVVFKAVSSGTSYFGNNSATSTLTLFEVAQ